MTQTLTLSDGGIAQKLTLVQERIRAQPADADLRAQLFQLAAVQGDWKRAADQLRISAELNRQAQPVAALYQGALAAEAQREAVFAGRAEPALLGPVEPWVETLAQALRAPAQAAADMRLQAAEAAQARAGSLACAPADARAPFAWLCDGDSRLGPVCELIAGGRYCWTPFAALRSLRILPPEGLADLIWAQAEAVFEDGRQLACLIPARYPAPDGAAQSELDEALRLGRRTEWLPLGGETYRGAGQKMWLTDAGEYALLDVRALELG